MKRLTKLFLIVLALFCRIGGNAQENKPTPIDEIIAVIGKEIVMRSDIESAIAEMTAQMGGAENLDDVRCSILQRLVTQKLLIHQAILDSVVISDQEVEERLNYQLAAYIAQVGDVKIIEDFYKKKIADIKKDMREMMRDQMIAERVRGQITDDLKITPTEVKDFFTKIPYDSLPTINEQYEIGHITKTPKIDEEQIADIKKRLNDYRQRILSGSTTFKALAVLYSEDPGSASKGGNLGFVERGQLYKEFEAVAFSLKTGEISSIVETQAGYHIIQMIERRGDAINVAHILLRPKASADEQVVVLEYLDSVAQVIAANDTIPFSKFAERFSEDPNKISGGWVVNPYTGNLRFELEQIDQATAVVLRRMAIESYSKPIPYQKEDGTQAYRIIYLKSKIPAHKPNMVEDYDMIKNAALEDKKSRVLENWIKNKVKVTNVKISDRYNYCSFIEAWNIPR